MSEPFVIVIGAGTVAASVAGEPIVCAHSTGLFGPTRLVTT